MPREGLEAGSDERPRPAATRGRKLRGALKWGTFALAGLGVLAVVTGPPRRPTNDREWSEAAGRLVGSMLGVAGAAAFGSWWETRRGRA